jgi:cyanophycinase
MKKFLVMFIAMVLVFQMSPGFASQEQIKGSLVIVGGALRADNEAVYDAFITRAGGVDHAKIGIVPAASGSPDKYAKMFTEDMVRRGVDPSRIVTLPLAVKDDSKSKDVDESLWSINGQNPEVAKMVEDLTGIWFVGGDQLRITEVLLTETGENTLVLDAIWSIYKEGAVVGGSSAGAAIMSDVMIAGGDSLSALEFGYTEDFDNSTMDYQNEGGLVISKGLGFFKHGIVDQHFDRKARLGRLAVLTHDEKETFPVAFGVEENTAMVYDNMTGMMTVAGTGGVVILDARGSVKNEGYDGFKLTYLEGLDAYDVEKSVAVMDPDKYTTLGYEYLYTEETVVGGPMSPNQRFRDFIAFELVDNEAKTEVTTYLLGEDLSGFAFTFYNGEDTEGYWGQSGAADLYSFENVYMSIKPFSMASAKETTKTYSVVSGDVLWKIAQAHDVKLEVLIQANGIANPNLIKVGQVLRIPN